MILCPNCQQKLPDGVGYCQFCHTAFPPIGTPVLAPYMPMHRETTAWIWPTYYAIAFWWIIYGIASTRSTFDEPGRLNVFGIMIWVAVAVTGFAILVRVDVPRKTLTSCCLMQLLGSGCGLILSLLGAIFRDHWWGLLLLMHLIGLTTGALMLYLITETEASRANR